MHIRDAHKLPHIVHLKARRFSWFEKASELAKITQVRTNLPRWVGGDCKAPEKDKTAKDCASVIKHGLSRGKEHSDVNGACQ
jgi:hypothetical protein